jgi:hypothetical protein
MTECNHKCRECGGIGCAAWIVLAVLVWWCHEILDTCRELKATKTHVVEKGDEKSD